MTIPTPDIPGPMPLPSLPQAVLPAKSCDTHAHLFGPAEQYPYQQDRSYTPPDASRQDYVRLLRTLGFQRAVLVQPSVYGTDNRLLCDVLRRAGTEPWGIEWRGIAVTGSDVTESELETMHELGVRGIRLNMLFRGGIDFATVQSLANRIAPLGWHLQFLIDITQFKDLAPRLSSLPVDSVIDHMGHFRAELGPRHPAFASLLSLLREGRTWVKVTGPNRISAHDKAPYTDAQALAQALMHARPDRLVFGTDWPHVQIPTPIPDDGSLVDEFYRWAENDMQLVQSILVDNPERLYSF
ncbi:MAG: amidohydrolase family protein [Alcaligenaceae bacterium]|nr:amidohydrolase family protein [Alcaligenaceae bacterium]